MSETSPRLALPFMQAAQAQKHVTHNEALRLLDAVVHLTILGFDAETPPALPSDGDAYALGLSPVGAWAGHAGKVATWLDAAWTFLTPVEGWVAVEAGAATFSVYSSGNWTNPNLSIDFDNISGVGVNTTSDATNRLAVSSDATLLSHAGTNHQVKVNKASATDTASLLFQSNWSGRAEMGLAGNDEFSIKVSDDGSAWDEVLKVGAGEGVITTQNMVGTTSSTGGLGAAVVETGSGANGSYTKIADGTLICVHNSFSTASGAASTWTLPASFINASYATTSTVIGGTPAVVTVSGATTTSVDLESFDLSGADTVTPSVNLIAIGRWF
ncbi:MAG: DUF2793 domain-containing protein [Maritimibacter sp.]